MHIYVILRTGLSYFLKYLGPDGRLNETGRSDEGGIKRRNEMKRDEIEVSLFSPDTFLAT